MNRTAALATGCATVALAGGVVATSSAIAAGSSHTVKFRGTQLQTMALGKSHEVEADVLRQAGKKVGYATETCDFGGTNDLCAVTYAIKGGVLYGHVTFPITQSGTAPSTAKGKITGGLGSYSGVKGSIKVVTSAGHGDYTITYSG